MKLNRIVQILVCWVWFLHVQSPWAFALDADLKRAVQSQLTNLILEANYDYSRTIEQVVSDHTEKLMLQFPHQDRVKEERSELQEYLQLQIQRRLARGCFCDTSRLFRRRPDPNFTQIKKDLFQSVGPLSGTDLQMIHNALSLNSLEGWKKWGWEMGEFLANLVGTGLIGQCAKYVGLGETGSGLVAGQFFNHFSYKLKQQAESGVAQIISPNAFKEKLARISIEALFLKRKSYLSEAEFELLDKAVGELLRQVRDNSHVSDDTRRKASEWERWLLLPRTVHSVDAVEAYSQLSELLKAYPEQSRDREEIEKMVREATLSSRLPDHVPGAKKVVASFVGPSRTGKTRLAENLGKILGLPICMIKPGDLASSQPAQGSSMFFDDPAAGPVNRIKAAILKCFAEKTDPTGVRRKNMVIVLDEIDKEIARNKATEAFLLQLLEKEDASTGRKNLIIETGTGTEFDVSRAFFVLTGNNPIISTDGSKALENRITHHLAFGALSREIKMNIAFDYAKRLLGVEILDTESESIVQAIVDESERRDIPGVGAIQNVLESYRHHLAAQKAYQAGSLPEKWRPKHDFDVSVAFDLAGVTKSPDSH